MSLSRVPSAITDARAEFTYGTRRCPSRRPSPCPHPVLRELTGDHEPLELLGRDVGGALQILDDGIDLAVDQRRQRIGRGVEHERLLLRFDVLGDGDVVERAHLGPQLNAARSARVVASSTGESSLVTTTNGDV